MTSSSKQKQFTVEQVDKILVNNEIDNKGNTDSETGRLYSTEEFYLDQEVQEEINPVSEERWLKS